MLLLLLLLLLLSGAHLNINALTRACKQLHLTLMITAHLADLSCHILFICLVQMVSTFETEAWNHSGQSGRIRSIELDNNASKLGAYLRKSRTITILITRCPIGNFSSFYACYWKWQQENRKIASTDSLTDSLCEEGNIIDFVNELLVGVNWMVENVGVNVLKMKVSIPSVHSWGLLKRPEL